MTSFKNKIVSTIPASDREQSDRKLRPTTRQRTEQSSTGTKAKAFVKAFVKALESFKKSFSKSFCFQYPLLMGPHAFSLAEEERMFLLSRHTTPPVSVARIPMVIRVSFYLCPSHA